MAHPEQKWNVLKYAWFVSASVSLVCYCELTTIANGDEVKIKAAKKYKYAYYTLKTIGTFHKVYWDWFVDWGLFAGTKKGLKMLRDDIRFKPWVYYVCMLYDLFGLFFWVLVLFIYKWSAKTDAEASDAARNLEFYSNIMWITWVEMIVFAIRRSVWVLIRIENEFFNNTENFRDIVTIPPIKKEE